MARLASALRRAGHHVDALTFLDDLGPADQGAGTEAEKIAERVGRCRPDIVLLGNVHGVGLDPRVLSEVFVRWRSLIVLRDLWWLTGRCAYAGPCTKFARGCDAACLTASDYPPLEPALIGDAWAAKRALLLAERPPVLLGCSNWAVGMARAAFPAGQTPRIDRIRLGVPLDIFRPADRDHCRDRLGLPRDRFIVLFGARFLRDPRKGGDQVWSLVRSMRLPDLLFVAVGAGDLDPLGLPAERFKSLGLVDMPVKTYSAGMMVRLSFAVSTCFRPTSCSWTSGSLPAIRTSWPRRMRGWSTMSAARASSCWPHIRRSCWRIGATAAFCWRRARSPRPARSGKSSPATRATEFPVGLGNMRRRDAGVSDHGPSFRAQFLRSRGLRGGSITAISRRGRKSSWPSVARTEPNWHAACFNVLGAGAF